MTPISHAEAQRLQAADRAYRKSADALDTVAWRAPSANRFDGRPANDVAAHDPSLTEMPAVPVWLSVAAGAVAAAAMGALLGGALHI
ncbi:MAG TPA: hypothetical protein VF633_04520 [Brevundimonas sp.]|jgi:hypothetical protein